MSFETKHAIVLNVVDTVVADQKKLEVRGYMSIVSNYHVRQKTEHWHGLNAVRLFHAGEAEKLIPFAFTIALPPPNYVTVKRGQCVKSPEHV